jgi:hypothetical protein
MYLVIRKFARMRSVPEDARRAESGICQMLKQSPGLRDTTCSMLVMAVAGSVTLFDSREAAMAPNEKAVAWVRESLADLIDGELDVTAVES